jgi:ubiquinone/menaquinone biosynthesis C-methylase UbiE
MCENAVMKTPPRKPPFKKVPKPGFAKRPVARLPAKKAAPKRYKKPNPPRTQKASYPPKNPTNSWGSVASWYDEHLKMEGTYHKEIVLPNLLRLVAPRRGEAIVDLASGTGFFAEAFAKDGAMVTGIDVSEELIAIARKNAPQVSFHVASAEHFEIVSSSSKDKVVIVLAIQNIEHVSRVFAEAARVLRPGGSLHVVMNHPAFRIPKRSFWGYDEKKKVQYRRLDGYLSEASVAIDMHPGQEGSAQTISYHRPLQYYFKTLQKAGFLVERLEEWTSHKESDSGPRKKAENDARKEFPLFLYLGAKKNSAA